MRTLGRGVPWFNKLKRCTPPVLQAAALVVGTAHAAHAGINVWTSTWPPEERAMVQALAIAPTLPSTIYAGTYYQGIFQSTDGGGSWTPIDTGLEHPGIVALAVDPSTPSTVYAGTDGGGAYKSTDGGSSWNAINNGLTTIYRDYDGGIYALAIDARTPSTLYAGTTGGGVFRSTDGGRDWSRSSTGLSGNVVGALAIDPTTPSTLYAGTYGGGIFRSTDSAGHWSALNNGITNRYVRALAIDPITPSTLYAGTNGAGVFQSTDAGEHWRPINTGLCDGNEQCIAALVIDPKTPSTLYAGTFDGVFEQLSQGGSWSAIAGLNAYVLALAIDPTASSTIYAGTAFANNGGVSSIAIAACNQANVASAGCEVPTPPATSTPGPTSTPCGPTPCAGSVCGNGVVEGDEECDQGGTCIGSANAGTPCTSNANCPGGICKTFGGHGCAANCTFETDVPIALIPGISTGLTLNGGTSGVTIDSDFLTFAAPLVNICSGGRNDGYTCADAAECPDGTCVPPRETLTIGKQRQGKIPVVVKATSIKYPGIPPGGGAGPCICVRGLPAKTCGGVLFEADGKTLATDCTTGFTAGSSVCSSSGKAPCTFVHGKGNAAAGEIGCEGLDDANADFVQDAGGADGAGGPPLVFLSGTGGPGSALFYQTMAITGVLGTCMGTDPASYGPDGVWCTDDDPPGGFFMLESTAPAVTGLARAVVHNANHVDGSDVGPISASGAPFSCSALAQGDASGAGLAQATGFVHLDTVGDVAVIGQFFAAAPTPTLGPCVGDCGGRCEVTISEIVTIVNIALGSAQPSRCPSGLPSGSTVDITTIIQAVSHALLGCSCG